MKRIYVASPLFDDMELQRNLYIANELRKLGHKVFLPQEDSGEAFTGTSREYIFLNDMEGLRKCDIVLALLDGRVPDEGTVFEMGAAYVLGKYIVAFHTDRRSFMQGHLNVMIEQSVNYMFHTLEDLFDYFKEV